MNAVILGAGTMGKVLKSFIEETEGINCVGMIEPLKGEKLTDASEPVDVIIDFSHPENLKMMEDYTKENDCALVIASTGFSQDEVKRIENISQRVPVVFTANYSLGITVMKKVSTELSKILSDSFDIEIIEKHHNKKLDSPSGTAKMLAAAINPDGAFPQIYGREGNQKRGKEIGIHAVRGGTIAGEHTVIFAGPDEIIELTHIAHSKKIFAAGAVKAAKFACGKEAGLYDMNDVLF